MPTVIPGYLKILDDCQQFTFRPSSVAKQRGWYERVNTPGHLKNAIKLCGCTSLPPPNGEWLDFYTYTVFCLAPPLTLLIFLTKKSPNAPIILGLELLHSFGELNFCVHGGS